MEHKQFEERMMLVRWFLIPVACVALLALGPAQSQSSTDGFVMLSPDEVQWKGPLGPIGVVSATIYGDPSKPGLYVQRVKFPPHVFDRPHFHPEDRHVTVIKGTWYVGTGEKWDPEKAIPLKTGSYMLHPAKAVHWDGAKDEEVIVQIVGQGPGSSTLVDPQQPFFVKIGD
jgi:quercetin dioxygenase-like cupin family protein